jgi:hypothetical protein
MPFRNSHVYHTAPNQLAYQSLLLSLLLPLSSATPCQPAQMTSPRRVLWSSGKASDSSPLHSQHQYKHHAPPSQRYLQHTRSSMIYITQALPCTNAPSRASLPLVIPSTLDHSLFHSPFPVVHMLLGFSISGLPAYGWRTAFLSMKLIASEFDNRIAS